MSVMAPARPRAPRLATAREERLAATAARVEAPSPVPLPPRLEEALHAMRWYDRRGLTAREAEHELGPRWRTVISELRRAGFEIREIHSKFAPYKTWRWVLEAEPTTGSEDDLGF